jgi:cytochrome P450
MKLSKQIKALFPLVDEILNRFKTYLKNNQETPLEGREICAKYTTDVVSSCIFNADAESFTKEKPVIREMGKRIFQMTPYLIFMFMLYAFFPFLSKIKKIKFVPKDVEEFFINLIGQAVEQREKDKIQRDDYLAYLLTLRGKKELSDIDIAAHGISFFTDGFDTSSLAICHAIFELANNKSAQEKLREEIKDVFDENGKIIYDKLLDNEYLDQVFNEALRMHPPALILNRECNEEIFLEDLDGKKHKILVGDQVNIPVYSIHYDSEYYPEPYKFKPERFNQEFGGIKAFKDKGVFLTFGDGPRICLGMRFAYMQSKAAIAMVVKNFDISVDSKTKFPLEIDQKEFLNAKIGGLWMRFKSLTN